MTLLGFVFGIALLALPAYVCLTLKTGLERQMAEALTKALAYIGIGGICIWCVQTEMHWLFSLPFVLLMALGGAWLTVRQARVSQRLFYVPMAAGIVGALTFTLLWMWLLVVGIHSDFAGQYMIPLSGLLIGAMTEADSAALHTYYMGLRHQRQLYEYLLGNGATHREATTYFLRRSFQKILAPQLHKLAMTLVFTSPIVFWSLLLMGCPIWTAVAWHIVIAAAMLFSSVAAMLIMVFVARHYSFDPYEALKPTTQEENSENETETEKIQTTDENNHDAIQEELQMSMEV